MARGIRYPRTSKGPSMIQAAHSSLRRPLVGLTASLSLVCAGMLAQPSTASAAPIFKAPYDCGQGWNVSTYGGHGGNGNARDFNLYPGQSDLGKPVLASAGGTVTLSRDYRGTGDRAGNFIIITHSSGWTTEYQHLASKNVRVGDTVTAAQVIGTVGDTGWYRKSGGGWAQIRPHLHYVQKYGGTAQPVAFDGSVIATGYSYGPSDPLHVSTNCGTVQPVDPSEQRSNKIRIRPVKNATKIRANAGPNSPTVNYELRVQQQIAGVWRTKKVRWTFNSKDNRTINMPRGQYRVLVPAQNGRSEAVSGTVRLRR